MSSEFGINIRYSLFGQSHGKAVGVLVDKFPAGEAIDFEELEKFLSRRKPGQSDLTTSRNESDKPVILSGLNERNITCGSPLCAVIMNQDTRSNDYDEIAYTPRPGHADYTAWLKWGNHADYRGGGHFSGRLTAALCIAGGIALQILARQGVFINAKLLEAGGRTDDGISKSIREAAHRKDSVGGIVECEIIYPERFSGLGEPMFDGVESQLARVLFGIPAVKGVEFGSGFMSARLQGSVNNDAMRVSDDGKVHSLTNHSGGILGGITNGMPVVFRAAFKPTPSIGIEQKTVNLRDMTNTNITVKGRHDPCVALRAVPVVEAAAACVMLDIISSAR